ncbi:MAG: acyltransferase [Acetobacteraceae bacterium]|nr:acyltransferase [Acetobacteraceae bacterium]
MRRLECLDGLRGLLATYVLVSHMAAFTVLPAWLTAPFTHGGAAVDVFFILSGTVILRSLEGIGFDRGRFLAARAARIMPAFLVVFALAVAVQPLPTALAWMPWVAPDDAGRSMWSTGWPRSWAAEIGAHLTMLHGLLPEGVLPGAWVSFLGAAWSLSTEAQFYGVMALAAPALRRRRTMERLFLGLAAAGLAWKWIGPEQWQFSRAFLPNKAQYFALGMASAAWLADTRAGAGRRFALVWCATLALCAVQGGLDKLGAPLVWTLCLAAQRGLGAGQERRGLGWLATLLRAPPLLRLGALSYCIYLVNEPVQKLLSLILALVVRGDGLLFTALWVPCAILLPLLMARLLHARVEQPASRAARDVVGDCPTPSEKDLPRPLAGGLGGGGSPHRHCPLDPSPRPLPQGEGEFSTEVRAAVESG